MTQLSKDHLNRGEKRCDFATPYDTKKSFCDISKSPGQIAPTEIFRKKRGAPHI